MLIANVILNGKVSIRFVALRLCFYSGSVNSPFKWLSYCRYDKSVWKSTRPHSFWQSVNELLTSSCYCWMPPLFILLWVLVKDLLWALCTWTATLYRNCDKLNIAVFIQASLKASERLFLNSLWLLVYMIVLNNWSLGC